MAASTTSAAAFLIDADNLVPEAIQQALQDLAGRGFTLTVLRAYGSPETLSGVRDVLQAHGARAMVNQGRGTTDAALVVDAMDLLHSGCLPATVAIGSSDADFAPLVVRLRESGRHVVCYAQAQKAAAEDLERVYAEVVAFGEPRRSPPRTAKAPAKAPAAAKAAAAPARKTARSPAAKAAAAPSAQAGRATGVLEGLPGFMQGRTLELNTVVSALKNAGAMAKSASASTFFSKIGMPVELLPPGKPNKIRLRVDEV
jgi:pyruvate/2-oxoglutarate dehydrogenase complex dihydrolipoamide acyltransferase (E2) component